VCTKQSTDGICVTSNPTNIPPSTNPPPRGENPPPTGIIPRGGEGQLCKIGYEHGEKYYYCDGNLVCKEQSTDGICVTPTSTPTTTPNNTAILTPTSKPICYPYGPNLPNCVTPTPTSTPTTTPTNTAILTPTSQPICYPYGPNLPNCVTPTPTSTPTTTPTNTAILTPTSQPICYPYGPNLPNCVTPTPTPRLLTETGVLANPGVLIIENVTNNKTLRLRVVSLVGSNYEHLFVDILPRQSYTYNYSRFCTWLRRNLSGHIAYSSSEDNFISVKWKKIDLLCDSYLLIGIE
jgi:hypothetical protein